MLKKNLKIINLNLFKERSMKDNNIENIVTLELVNLKKTYKNHFQ